MMELSKQNQEMEQTIQSKEEEMLAQIIEQSKTQEEERSKMVQKNDQLLEMLKKIEDEKPENWGLKKINAEDINQDNIMEVYAHNLQKALRKLEIEEKINALKQENAGSTAESIQKDKMQIHRQKLLDARNAQREVDLMRSTFHNISNEEEKVSTIRGEEDIIQKSGMEAKLAERQLKRGTTGMNVTGMNFNVVKDGYDGGLDIDQKTEKEENDDGKKVLDDDFLGDLKAVDVPDSDEECYF